MNAFSDPVSEALLRDASLSNGCNAWLDVELIAAGDMVTSSYTLQFLAPAKAPRLRATAAVVKAGKRQVTLEAKIYAEPDDEAPKLVAMAMASITDAFESRV